MITAFDTLSQIALQAPHSTQVLSRYKLDFCCGGGTSLAAACANRGLNPESVLEEIELAKRIDAEAPVQGSMSDLIAHLIAKHHEYTRSAMQEIERFSVRVAAVHGAAHPEVIALRDVFAEFKADMDLHLMKEERALFPYIQMLDGKDTEPEACFPTVKAPVKMMKMEHETAGDDLRRMREITGDYALPAGACNTFRLLYEKLQELEADVHVHMHLENHVLFPRAIAAEESFRSEV